MDTIQSIDDAHRHIRTIWLTDYQQVIELAGQTLDQSRALEYTLGEIRSLNYLAWGYNRRGQYAAAFKPATEANQLAITYELPLQEGYALVNLALCYLQSGQQEKALEALTRQLEIARAEEDGTLLYMALNDLGALHLQINDFDRAAAYLRESLDVVQEVGPLEAAAADFARNNLAVIYAKIADYSGALAILNEIIDAESPTSFVNGLINAYNLRASIYLEMEQFEKAEMCCRRGLTLAEEHNINAHYLLNILARLRHRQGRTEDALALYHEALTIADESGSTELTLHLHSTLSELYEAQGDYRTALFHARTHASVNADNAATLARNQVRTYQAVQEVENLQHQLHQRERSEAERMERQRLNMLLETERDLRLAKYQILTRLSHEFRTPLTVLRTSFDLITQYRDRLTPEKLAQQEQRVDMQFRDMERLLDDIMNVLRTLDEDHIELFPQRLSLRALAVRVIDMTMQQKRIQLTLTGDDYVTMDKTVLQEILWHLLDNALKFSQDAVDLDIKSGADTLTILVSDSGIGIPDAEQDDVFEPLVRGSNINEQRGAGLGLSIIKNLVYAMGGEITLKSAIDPGTTVTVTLPV